MGVGVIVMEGPRISFRSAIFVCTVLEPVMPTADLPGSYSDVHFLIFVRGVRPFLYLASFLPCSVPSHPRKRSGAAVARAQARLHAQDPPDMVFKYCQSKLAEKLETSNF